MKDSTIATTAIATLSVSRPRGRLGVGGADRVQAGQDDRERRREADQGGDHAGDDRLGVVARHGPFSRAAAAPAAAAG
jgi:hypothetical protein